MRIIAVLLCGALAACSQTDTKTNAHGASRAMAKPAAKPGNQQTAATRCAEAATKMQQQSANAAMLGGAMSMVGGFGGFAGRGGAVAAQAVSVGGSLVQAKARNDAQAAMEQECLS